MRDSVFLYRVVEQRDTSVAQNGSTEERSQLMKTQESSGDTSRTKILLRTICARFFMYIASVRTLGRLTRWIRYHGEHVPFFITSQYLPRSQYSWEESTFGRNVIQIQNLMLILC